MRWIISASALVASLTLLSAQQPGRLGPVVKPSELPPGVVLPPSMTMPPGMLPGSVMKPEEPKAPAVITPQLERFLPLDAGAVNIRSNAEHWLLVAGPHVLANFGKDQAAAEEARLAVRELKPTDWASIGSAGLHYGLTGGKANALNLSVKQSVPIDLKSVRAAAVRGVWVLKDEANILVNFGLAKHDAEQAAAVIQKYGFNRLGRVGFPNPTFQYLFAEPVDFKATRPNVGGPSALHQAAAEQALNRTGIPVPGVGFVGERIVIDPRRIDIRKDGGEYKLVSGNDVLGRFGPSEWSARDALKFIQDSRFTEFCKIGETTFFLIDGKPPTKVPFNVQGRSFDPKNVKARNLDGRFGVYDGSGRLIFSCTTAEEAEQTAKAIQGFGFDTVCRLGLSDRTSLKFLAKTGSGR